MPVKAGVIEPGRAPPAAAPPRPSPASCSRIRSSPPRRRRAWAGRSSSFTPGARTAWHSHPVGQTLFCLSGIGRICFEGEQPQVLNPGDTVNIPPNTMHWHGASPDRLFSHLALSEAGEKGEGTAWGKHVSDEEYGRAGHRRLSSHAIAGCRRAGAPLGPG